MFGGFDDAFDVQHDFIRNINLTALVALFARNVFDNDNGVADLSSVDGGVGDEVSFVMERVIIYGAGDIGREFYREAKQEPYVKVLALVDKNAFKLVDLPMPAARLDILEHFDYDSILISIHDEYVAGEVKDMLMKRGISAGKIKWDGLWYYKDEFYQNYYFENLRFLAGIGKSEI